MDHALCTSKENTRQVTGKNGRPWLFYCSCMDTLSDYRLQIRKFPKIVTMFLTYLAFSSLERNSLSERRSRHKFIRMGFLILKFIYRQLQKCPTIWLGEIRQLWGIFPFVSKPGVPYWISLRLRRIQSVLSDYILKIFNIILPSMDVIYGLRARRLRLDSRKRQEIISHSTRSRVAPGSPSLISNEYRVFLPRVRRQVREADHSPPSSAEVKNGGAISPLTHTSDIHSDSGAA
jgi:hypothetical protein